MMIVGIQYYTFKYDSDGKVPDSGSSTGLATTSQLNTSTNKIKNEDSLYGNGTFPAFGVSSLPPQSQAVSSNRNAVIAIPPGSLRTIIVRVRQDNNFYNKYIKSANNEFAPEIFLIPGISVASGFAGQLSPDNLVSRLGNPLQKIRSAADYWSSTNPYWSDNPVIVNINGQFNPGDVLFGSGDMPPAPGKERNININVDSEGNMTCGNKSGFTSNSESKSRGNSIKDLLKSTNKIANKVVGTQRAIANKYKLKF
jgi:hypothetical protein